jgi:hypothetical protein
MARTPQHLKSILRSLAFLAASSISLQGVAAQSYFPPTQISPHEVRDFNQCYQDLTIINNTIVSDPEQLDQWDKSGYFYGDPKNSELTLAGCRAVCGTGYVTWRAEDSFGRIGMWIVPALVLLGRLAFPILDPKNCFDVICHVIGNPIDSLFSLIVRYETQIWLERRVYAIVGLSEGQAKDVAEICIVYEQFGWMVTTPEYFERSFRFYDEKFPRAAEWVIIEDAARQLRILRQKSTVFALMAIGTLVLSLLSAIFQTINQIEQAQTRINIEVAHTIAVVCLLFFSIPLVWFSSRIGTYTCIIETIHIINNMRSRLHQHSQHPHHARGQPLFPELPSVPSIAPGKPPITINEKNWPNHAAYYGVHSYWRPSKRLPTDSANYKETGTLSSTALLCLSASWVVFGAALPAIFLSATNHTNLREVGFGCRSLSWTLILTTWLLSFLCDIPIRAYIKRDNNPWATIKVQRNYMMIKDFFITCAIIVAVMMVQFGVYNSCFCRASFEKVVILKGYTNLQWLVAKILWAGIPSTGLLITGSMSVYLELRGGKLGIAQVLDLA